MNVASGRVSVEEKHVWDFIKQVFESSYSKKKSTDKFMKQLAMNRSTAIAAKEVTHKTVTLDDDTLDNIQPKFKPVITSNSKQMDRV